jgi:hypothetical protein
MDIKAILVHLNKEKVTLNAAIKALQAINGTGPKGGRPTGTTRRRGRLSAAARKRISQAQKARWTKVRAKARAKKR